MGGGNNIQTQAVYSPATWDYLLHPTTVDHVPLLWNIKIHDSSWLVISPSVFFLEDQSF